MTKFEAIAAVIMYHTLPPQIDYTEPYWRKAVEGYAFIEELPEEEQKQVKEHIEQEIQNYYTPGENGYSAAELAAMF